MCVGCAWNAQQNVDVPGRCEDRRPRELGLGRRERAASEGSVIVRSLPNTGPCDQLKLPGLASAKVFCQWLARFIKAYAVGDRGAPDYRLVEHFIRESPAAQVVPPAPAYAGCDLGLDYRVVEHFIGSPRLRAATRSGNEDGDGDGTRPLGRRVGTEAAQGEGKAAAAAGLTAAAVR